jgi:DNA-binding CsgD family transcriptional regulator
MTARARLYIEKYFGGLGANDRLPEKLEAWACQQDKLLHRALAAPQCPLVVTREDSELRVTSAPDGSGMSLILQEQLLTIDFTRLGLTRRESDVLLWVTRGKSNEEIGLILGISLRTVKKHLEQLFRKLDVESRTAAAMVALRQR